MRLPLAQTVRSATLALTTLGLAASAFAQAEAEKPADPPAPTAVRFDPGRMPGVEANPPALGWRYGRLSSRQQRVLRRGFKLPLDALAAAKSPRDLVRSAVVAPLPDPSKPLLAVAAKGTDAADPFAGEKGKRTAFRDDPMKALGEWLGATEDDADGGEAFAGSSDPFSADDGGGFEAASDADSSDADSEPDPFADDLGSDDDPFADF